MIRRFFSIKLYYLIGNVSSSKAEEHYSVIHYITESHDWVITRVGKYITENLSELGLKARITTTHLGIRNQIIHFGSVNTFLTSKGFKKPHQSNKVVLTWFHVIPDDPRIKFVKDAQNYVNVVHTSSLITRDKLIEIGIPEDKIVVVPLGVDRNSFKPASLVEKEKIRDELGIPKDKIVIGSFQKDGVGWREGLEPKWVKGPDVFVEVVDELNKNYNILVLLLGPARGFVKRELDKLGIAYKHVFLKNYLEIPKYYNALDLYVVTSREEGGPKAVLEAMATGIPLVSTKVGMAPELIKDSFNGFLTDVDDVEGLSKRAREIIEDKTLASQLANNALHIVRNYSWETVTKLYYDLIYKSLLMDRLTG